MTGFTSQQPLAILLAAEESAGLRVLRTIVGGPHRIVAVMTSANAAVGRLAADNDVLTWPAARVRDPSLADEIRHLGIDLLLNIHSLHIIHEDVVVAPRLGAYNLHPGPLPEYAGLNVVSWALCRGERNHGVTLHRMGSGIDTGPIAYQKRFPIEDSDTALTVFGKCIEAGVRLVQELLDTAASDPDRIPSLPQDRAKWQYFAKKAIPNEGKIDWNRSSREVFNFVRAFDYGPFTSPWGKPETSLNGISVSILKVELTGNSTPQAPGSIIESSGRVLVACADEWLSLGGALLGGQRVAPTELLATSAAALRFEVPEGKAKLP